MPDKRCRETVGPLGEYDDVRYHCCFVEDSSMADVTLASGMKKYLFGHNVYPNENQIELLIAETTRRQHSA